MAEDLRLADHALRSLLSVLEEAGLLIARGRLRRIVPDVLADHILYRACIDRQGQPTGRSEELLKRYSGVALVSLLRNLAELDWRVGETDGDVDLLTTLWRDVRQQFLRADAEQRLRIIELVRPVAALAPAPVFELVRDALTNPAQAVQDALFSFEVTDENVRLALPRLLGSVALTQTYLADALSLLWQLGRDDDRPLHQHPDHALRVLEELASYQLPVAYARVVVDFVEGLLDDKHEMDGRTHSPLKLLQAPLAREGITTRATGLGVQTGSYSVSAAGTAPIRAAVREILVRQATGGGFRNRVLAAELLGESLTQPRGYFGQAADLNQWHDDQLAILAAIEEVMNATDDPHGCFELRGNLEWHADHSAFEDVRPRARALFDTALSERERLVMSILQSIDWQDREGSEARLREFAQTLANNVTSAEALADQLDAEVAALFALPKRVHVDAAPLLMALAEVDPALGARLAEWCVANSERPLAPFGGSLLVVAGRRSPEELRGLLEALRSGDVPARRQLAGYLSVGTWFDDPERPEAEMLREVVADEDPAVVGLALLTVARLAQQHPKFAVDVALEANIGTDSRLADQLCMSISHVTEHLEERQVRALLDRLRPVVTLEYWPNDVLGKLAPQHRADVLEFLLDRASAGGDVRALSFHDYDVDLLGGAQGKEQLELLRRVRHAAIGADSRLQWELNHLYWRLTDDLEARLTVLLEWLVDDTHDRVKAALALLEEMPWDAILVTPPFVEKSLAAADRRGLESLREVRDALFSATVMTGDHSRTLGQPSPRDARLRDEGTECASSFDAGSLARRFFEDVVARAEQNIEDAAREDEEYPELRG